nr:reverse transcriptase domain-containing protein [Tanacetum cinerariifolium]
MRTRRSYFLIKTNVMIPRRLRKQISNIVKPELRTIIEMADNRTMAQMLQALIEGYEDVIVVPPINANNFELKQTLINLVQSNQFTSKQDPHNHLRFFNKVTSTYRHPEVPNTTIKLLLFLFSLEGDARTWLDKEPPRSILTWEDLVSKFINQFFPPSKTTYLRNEIINFLQKPNETFNEAWERFKDHLRQCPHHDKLDIRMSRFEKSLNDMKALVVTPPAPIKAGCLDQRDSACFDTVPPLGDFRSLCLGRQDPHNHLRFFNKVTSTFRHLEVLNTTIKLLLVSFSLEGEARTWLDKEPPRSILTWEDLVLKFINQFFPPSKTTYLRNEIINFLQKLNETFNEAWERFKDLLMQCTRHGFSELHQLDTFYNALNTNDQDALDSATVGNFLDKIPRECLALIKSK